MEYRRYDPQKDEPAIRRLWREIGWLRRGEAEAMDLLVGCGRALVTDINGEAECLVTTTPGTLRYLKEELPFSCVATVATSRIARQRRLAKGLTALAVAADVADGALVSGLGMFDQGFYDQLGFGTGGYEHQIAFDPLQLKVRVKARVPSRITPDDWASVHAARLKRLLSHGSCTLTLPEVTRAEMLQHENGFGLGYYDGPHGELSHHLWCWAKDVDHGPYNVKWMTFQTREQFLELMVLIKSLGDQVRLVTMREPPGIQLQDLLERPFRQLQVSEGSRYESHMRATAYWQMRICDLGGCLAGTHLRGSSVRFNLRLTDPIHRFLGPTAPWRGLSGDYVVTLGPSSGAEPGRDASLPTLAASVGAFTRLWLGVRPASGLAMTDELSGPEELLKKLDWVLCLPNPKPDFDF